MKQQSEREAQLEAYRATPASELLESLLHGSCEPSTAEQALREKMQMCRIDTERGKNRIPDSFVNEYLEKTKGAYIFGVPIEKLSRNELLACVSAGLDY